LKSNNSENNFVADEFDVFLTANAISVLKILRTNLVFYACLASNYAAFGLKLLGSVILPRQWLKATPSF